MAKVLRGHPTGWAIYIDAEYSVGSPQAVVAGVRELLENDALDAGTNEDNLIGPASWWAGDKIIPSAINEAYDMRLGFTIDPAQTNGSLTLDLDIGADPFGAGSIVIVEQSVALLKGAVAQEVVFSFPIFCLATFVANGGCFGVTCDKNANIYGCSLLLTRVH